MGGNEPVQAIQRQELEEVEAGQELDADAAQIGRRLVHPLLEHGPSLRGELVYLARRAVRLLLDANRHQPGFFQQLELGVELALPNAPHTAQLAAELLVQLVAVLGL